jgi:uncharacterized protein YcbX
VVTGAAAWEEDTWKVVIGEVIFDVVKPCSRCVDYRQPGARAKASFRGAA